MEETGTQFDHLPCKLSKHNAQEREVSKGTVKTIVKLLRLHPYKNRVYIVCSLI